MKNALFLFSTDDHQYLNFLRAELGKRVVGFHCFNFVEYSCRHGIKRTERYIETFIAEKKIDIVLSSPFATNHELSIDFYASLKNRAKVVFWMFDDAQYFDSYSKYYCQTADAVITFDHLSVFAYRKLGIPAILFFPTYDKTKYYPVETDKDIDVCFRGDCTKSDRLEYINFLLGNGIKVEAFGKGSKNGFIELDMFLKLCSRSKINLNFTKLDKLSWIDNDEPLVNRIRSSKGRPFEIAFTKSFCLSEYSPDLEIFFEIGKEIDVFHNKEELLEKIRYYLQRHEKRAEMAANAYKKAIENYEAGIYFPKLLKELEEILEGNDKQRPKTTGIFVSRGFKVKAINGLTFFMFVLIKNGEIKHALESFAKLFKYGFCVFLPGFCGGLLRVVKNIADKSSGKISRLSA